MDAVELGALMAAAQDGDALAYSRALTGCVPLIAAIARRRGVPSDRVDDVVQDSLIGIHRALPTYDPARPFAPWLAAIATRRSIDSLRLHGRRAAAEVHDEAAYLAHAETRPDALETVGRSGDTARLRAAVATLPAGQRQAVELLALQEKSLDEASLATGRTKGALKVNLHRALHALRLRVRPKQDV